MRALFLSPSASTSAAKPPSSSMVSEDCILLTPPLSLDGESDASYKAPNLIRRIISLFKNVRPGSDLNRFQLPPLFNMPKSQLQVHGETVYCTANDMLSRCSKAESSLDRFASVVAWSISIARPVMFGVVPFNPVLGETHHVSKGTLNVLLEQVSHHPPVAALHATDEKENIEMIWCQYPVPKFYGTSVEAEIKGNRELRLLKHGENYVMNAPRLLIRFLPVPSADWVGTVRIRCQETDLEAELCYKGTSFLGRRSNYRSVTGKIFESSSSKTIYEIDGHWDRTVSLKDISTGKLSIIYNAKDVLCGLKTAIVNDPKGVWPSESAAVWSEVSRGIMNKDWDKAREAKTKIEEKERAVLRERKARGETWEPKHFKLFCSKESGWECLPLQNLVPPAPIVVPQ